jgi:hypothetical protein
VNIRFIHLLLVDVMRLDPLCVKINKLPREIQLKIFSYLDIDSRRALGIYTKLEVPLSLKRQLRTIPLITPFDEEDFCRVRVGLYIIDKCIHPTHISYLSQHVTINIEESYIVGYIAITSV